MISHVYKRKRKKNCKTVASRTYRGRYRLTGDFLIDDVPLNTPDKQVAEQKLREIIKEKEQEKAGIIAPRLQRQSADKHLDSHLTDYLNDLTIQGRSTVYIKQIASRNRRLFNECDWRQFKDVTPDSFISSDQRELAPKTLNDYLNAISALLNWCVKSGRAANNSLHGVAKVETRGKQQKRRAFTDEELARLVEFAQSDVCST
ncbi:hypothetical protein [Rubellicoccus peritrichatus]|uniref:Core-binding (CB) domain-containing protein n=1 Tax=Rubellicoccus peritrichatus TaxID=3080537 RepID=A0AAQ3L6B5_9BACT|nr:hypothetical protein [Puniceicoccus sp. CR14]WOO40100.1 hypothetical protein RZN69_15875 [Puniceicoccus sp. CR14]